MVRDHQVTAGLHSGAKEQETECHVHYQWLNDKEAKLKTLNV